MKELHKVGICPAGMANVHRDLYTVPIQLGFTLGGGILLGLSLAVKNPGDHKPPIRVLPHVQMDYNYGYKPVTKCDGPVQTEW